MKVRHANVPIVPAAALFDLLVGDDPTIRPTSDSRYQAADAVADAIMRAVRQATSIEGWPAARDLGK